MRNKKTFQIIFAMAAAAFLYAGAVIAVNAENSISSTGNFVFSSGEVAFYAEDIEFLQNEINQLFNEIKD